MASIPTDYNDSGARVYTDSVIINCIDRGTKFGASWWWTFATQAIAARATDIILHANAHNSMQITMSRLDTDVPEAWK